MATPEKLVWQKGEFPGSYEAGFRGRFFIETERGGRDRPVNYNLWLDGFRTDGNALSMESEEGRGGLKKLKDRAQETADGWADRPPGYFADQAASIEADNPPLGEVHRFPDQPAYYEKPKPYIEMGVDPGRLYDLEAHESLVMFLEMVEGGKRPPKRTRHVFAVLGHEPDLMRAYQELDFRAQTIRIGAGRPRTSRRRY